MSDINSTTMVEFCINQASNLAYRIREERQRQGYTIDALANHSGLDRTTISKIESGSDYQFSIRGFFVICWALGIQPAEALGYVNRRPRVSSEEHELILAHRKIFGGEAR